MDIRTGIIDAANALGVSPNDLATIISYETGGTFDPTQAGPVTKYGQHRGFLQFGEPQAQKYGINWSDPVNSQLGANGAVVRYLKDTGVEPGMSILDMYSAVNAGGVGRYNARDVAAGGAPGTVAEKVTSMGPHQTKATALLGGQFQPSALAAQTKNNWVDNNQPEPFDDSAAFEELLASRPEATPEQPRSLLADDMTTAVGRSRASGGMTPSAADDSAPLPTLDFASATPENPPSPAKAGATEASGDRGLADLFKVRDIGLSNQTDPVTGTPRLLRTRRTYG